MMLEEGSLAPDFALPNENGETVRLSDLRGRTVVVYFYPKDDTPGCTKEACSFRDNTPALTEKDAVVLGVSADSAESHRTFKQKYELPFSLLSDPEHRMIEAWGAWGQKSMYGKTYDGIMRYTYVIDPQGIVKKAFKKVETASHGADVLEYI